MSQPEVFAVPEAWASRAKMDAAGYDAALARVEAEPDKFWSEVARRLDWIKPFSVVKDVSFARDDFHIRWFADGVLNVSANCLDRHLPARAQQTAIIWEGDDPAESKHITYAELHAQVCRLANVLRAHGVKKGDRVTIYMPMIPEAAYAMLACARIGAIHSVVFGGFSPDALAGRIQGAESAVVITADEGLRGGRKVPLKANVDVAADKAGCVKHVLVVKRTGGDIAWKPGRDVWLGEAMAAASPDCPAEPMEAEAPLFILYTSGSTGDRKSVV